jgi:hypothetical protein
MWTHTYGHSPYRVNRDSTTKKSRRSFPHISATVRTEVHRFHMVPDIEIRCLEVGTGPVGRGWVYNGETKVAWAWLRVLNVPMWV